MHVEQYGHGPRIYLAIHGWGGTHRDFLPITHRIPPDITLFSVDLPGCGRSPPPDDWTPDYITNCLCSLMAANHATRYTLIGFCSGAAFAMHLARFDPDHVERLIMIDPFDGIPWYFRLFLIPVIGRSCYRMAFGGETGRGMVNRILQRRQGGKEDFTEAFVDLDTDTALRYLRLFNHFGDADTYRELALPVDLVYGEKTFAAVRAAVERYRTLWPGSRVHEMPGANHLPLVVHAPRIAGILFKDGRSYPTGQ